MNNRVLRSSEFGCKQCECFLFGYSEGELQDAIRNRVASHLARCEECRLDLAAISEVRRVLVRYPVSTAPVSADLWRRVEAEIRSTPRRPFQHFSLRRADVRIGVPALAGFGFGLPAALAVLVIGVCVGSRIESFHRQPAQYEQTVVTSQPSTALAVAKRTIDWKASSESAAKALPFSHPGKVALGSPRTSGVRLRPRPHHNTQPKLPLISDANRIMVASVTRKDVARRLSRALANQEIGAVASQAVDLAAYTQIAASKNRPTAAVPTVLDRQSSANYLPHASALATERPGNRAAVAFADPERRRYVSDDGPAASVSILDVAGSARRQQDLFTY